MENGKPVIAVFGAQRLWRQALKNILGATLGADAIREAADPRMEVLRALTPFDWVVVFLPSPNKLERMLARLSRSSIHTNVLLLSMEGTAVARRADRAEQRYHDISLDELLSILNQSHGLDSAVVR